jgi:8-oxo-dGTP pyrophosphatase MutT (NUDIX family)
MKRFNYKLKYPSKSLLITSFGIIHIYDKKYLMICRRKTLGFTDFIQGKYSFHHIRHIHNLIDEMTLIEKENILQDNFTNLWNDLWGVQSENTTEKMNAEEKFNIIKKGYHVNDEFVCLKQIIENSLTSWTTPEWGFPKGRKNTYETELSCALREYEEETGYNKYGLQIISNILPYEEIFTGSNYKCYNHKYFIAISTTLDQKHSFQDSEVSDMKWVSYEEAVQLIRPYNMERIQILHYIHSCLSNYILKM